MFFKFRFSSVILARNAMIMKTKNVEYKDIISTLERLVDQARKFEVQYQDQIQSVHPKYRKSAINLVHYWALRQEDIRSLQNKLKKIGLSRLGKAEAHIQASMLATYSIVKNLASQQEVNIPESEVSIPEGERLLVKNTKALLGNKTAGRSVRIMVTQPEQASENKELIKSMLLAGMNIARINCAHDAPAVWLKIINNIKSASESAGVKCKTCMDLGGPKVRTGKMSAGPRVKKLRPLKDEFGRVIKPYEFSVVPDSRFNEKDIHQVPVDDKFFSELSENTELRLVDTRGKSRIIFIGRIAGYEAEASVSKTTYLMAGTKVSFLRAMKHFVGEVGNLPESEGSIKLYKGDVVHLFRQEISGKEGIRDREGKLVSPPVFSFTLPEIFGDLNVGEKVLFDDGKIEGLIESKNESYVAVNIVNASIRGSRLRADKGINFPESNLNISGLTEKDKEDLKFVAKHADIVNLSFVNSEKDIGDLYNEFAKNTFKKVPGIILKIETKKGYKNLFEILLKSMQNYPVGVMIARGDLAIECGWQNMARVQEEILSLCNAAHVPVIWATQVLENMAKTGFPSRSEITDAATAQRAECVMLNKGPNILEAIKLLDVILKNMKDYQEKKANMLPAFN